MIYLIRPEAELEVSIMEYRQEFLSHHEKHILGSGNLHHFTNFNAWLSQIRMVEKQQCTDTTTPADTFLALRPEDMYIIGTIQVRHSMTKALDKCGGHIGYGVRPSERQKGYASSMLEIALSYSCFLGIPSVRVDCEKTNTASAKTILKCGGILDKEVLCSYPGYTQTVLQYHIETAPYADRFMKYILL